MVLKNVESNLDLISVFTVDEPNKNSIPCADFKLVPKDTLTKYNLNTLGKLGVYPKKKLHIKSKIIQIEKADNNEEGYVFKRTIQHKFKIGWKTLHVEILNDLTFQEKDEIKQPRIKQIFGKREINKYYLIIIKVDESVNPETKKKHTIIDHKKIIIG